jgi:hypothetical protein
MAPSKQWSTQKNRRGTDLVQSDFDTADDIALTYQAQSYAEFETNLGADLERLSSYFGRWRLQPNA